MSDVPSTYRPRCKNFCSKSLMVYGESFEMDPDYQAGLSDAWCNKTSCGHGPDSDGVTLELCSEPTRVCFEEF